MLFLSPYVVNGFDSDTITYINAVESADNQTLEWNTRMAFDKFIKGCKSDSIWDAIKASCILAGARTLDGALTPLKGTAPTNFNFVANDYNRKTGLMGDGENYLDSNRSNNADPQDDKHIAVWRTKSETRDQTRCALGSGEALLGESQLLTTNTNRYFRVNYGSYGTSNAISDNTAITGFWGASRSTSAEISSRYNQSDDTVSDISNLPTSDNLFVFSRDLGFSASDAWISFYSIGTSLNLALLDTRVSQLMTDINNAF